MMPSKHTPLVSVAIITYNQEETIGQTIDSILQQKCDFPFEIVIGDDNSKDNTINICQQYVKQYPDIIFLLKKEKNTGLIKNYTDTILHCNGKYVAQCAGDDYWTDPLKLQKQISFLEDNPDYGLVHTDFNILQVSKQSIINNISTRDIGNIFEKLLNENQIGALTVVYKRAFILEALNDGIFDQGFLMEDYPLWLFISQKSKIGYIDKVTAVWRMNTESSSNSSNLRKKYLFETSKTKVKRFFAEKHSQTHVVIDSLIDEYKWALRGAYEFQDIVEGKNAFAFLQKNNKIGFKEYLYYFFIRFPFFIKIYRGIKHKKNID